MDKTLRDLIEFGDRLEQLPAGIMARYCGPWQGLGFRVELMTAVRNQRLTTSETMSWEAIESFRGNPFVEALDRQLSLITHDRDVALGRA